MNFKAVVISSMLSTLAFAGGVEKDLKSMCAALDGAYKKRSWGSDPCDAINWIQGGTSVKGRPLIYAEFGAKESKNVTLILSMVHGDEITPLYTGFQMTQWAKSEMK